MTTNAGGALLALALTTCCAACGSDRVTRVDEGKICLYATEPETPHQNAPAQSYLDGESVHVSVTLGCVSACIENEEASCTVVREGQTLHVHSAHSYDPPEPETACIALCGTISAVCASQPLPAGEYEVMHGEERHPLLVPSTVEQPCW